MECPNCQRTMQISDAECPACGARNALLLPLQPGQEFLRIDASQTGKESLFDANPSNALVWTVLDGKPPVDIRSYEIQDRYVLAGANELDQAQLNLQAESLWGYCYKHWHKVVHSPGNTAARTPRSILVLGVPENAAQLRFLLDTYPNARIVAIEINSRNQEMAMETLRKTNPRDVESGRVEIKVGDASEMISTLPKNSFDLVEADKVISHMDPAGRKSAYQAIANTLATGGILHHSDLIGATLRTGFAAGYEDNPKTQEVVKGLNSSMQMVLDVAFKRRGRYLWESVEKMAEEAMNLAPDLSVIPSLSVSYELPLDGPDTRTGALVKIFCIMPFVSIEAAKARGSTPEMEEASRMLHQLGERIVRGVETEGVLTALPSNGHSVLRRTN